MSLEKHAASIHKLFEGCETIYGVYEVTEHNAKKKTGRARTLKGIVSDALWLSHLKGEQSIGIIPIRDDNTTTWGCIDVDDYDISLHDIARKIAELKLPLIVCRTKSGGAHIFAFLSEPIPAKELIDWLREIAGGLGFGESEIFPKQSQVLRDKGDMGNWLNMPYFQSASTRRFAVSPDGNSLKIDQFLAVAERALINPKHLKDIGIVKDDSILPGGPPCLQVLCQSGFPSGTRNNGLFNLGTYYKRAKPDDWRNALEQANQDFMKPPLTAEEVQQTIKQLERKDYQYKCNDQPLVMHCNSGLCRTRKHGIAQGSAMPIISALSKISTEPPIWFLDIEGNRIELQTDELQQQEKFQRHCMNILNIMPPRLKQNEWQKLVQGLLDNVTVIEQPEEVTIAGQFKEILEMFCRGKAIAEDKEGIWRGLPWTGDHRNQYKTWFRIKDLYDYMHKRQLTKSFPMNVLVVRLTEYGAVKDRIASGKRYCNVWGIDPFEEEDQESEPL